MSASQFGLPTGDPTALAFVRAAGARDLAIGLAMLGSLHKPKALRRLLGWSIVISLADSAVLAAARGLRPSHALHLGGAVALAYAAATVAKDGS